MVTVKGQNVECKRSNGSVGYSRTRQKRVKWMMDFAGTPQQAFSFSLETVGEVIEFPTALPLHGPVV